MLKVTVINRKTCPTWPIDHTVDSVHKHTHCTAVGVCVSPLSLESDQSQRLEQFDRRSSPDRTIRDTVNIQKIR